ncbi:hypothetical protein Hanom_Chr02g00162751 [Helianthus anomalus]
MIQASRSTKIKTHLTKQNKTNSSLFVNTRRRSVVVLVVERRDRVTAFNYPAESEERNSGEYGGAPSVSVPFAVLSGGVLPLLP